VVLIDIVALMLSLKVIPSATDMMVNSAAGRTGKYFGTPLSHTGHQLQYEQPRSRNHGLGVLVPSDLQNRNALGFQLCKHFSDICRSVSVGPA